MSEQDNEVQKIGPYFLRKVKPGPTSAGIAPTYATCTPDRWGMRYSDLDPKRPGELMYPVARNFARDMKNVLIDQIQWADTFLGPKNVKPKLTLRSPIDNDQFQLFVDLIKPAIENALTSHAGGFGLPDAVMPEIVSYKPQSGWEQGAFAAATCTLFLNLEADALNDVLLNKVDDWHKIGQIGVFVNTIYHEMRHCQQSFWCFALVQQHVGNFEEIPNIKKWPMESAEIAKHTTDTGKRFVSLAAHATIPDDVPALISLKRMAVGEYLYELAFWKRVNVRPTYLSDEREFEDEYRRAHDVAANLLQHVGLGGTAIDVDAMVAEPRACGADYSGRPWENDAFVTGDMAGAYWLEANNRPLYTFAADQCSKSYAGDYAAHQYVLRMQRAANGSGDGK